MSGKMIFYRRLFSRVNPLGSKIICLAFLYQVMLSIVRLFQKDIILAM